MQSTTAHPLTTAPPPVKRARAVTSLGIAQITSWGSQAPDFRYITSVVPPSTRLNVLQTWLGKLVLMVLLLALTLLTLWRGRDVAAWALSAVGLAFLILNGLLAIPAPMPIAFWLNLVTQDLVDLTLVLALYVMAEALARTGLPPGFRRWARITCTAVALSWLGTALYSEIGLVQYGRSLPAAVGTLASVSRQTLIALSVLVLLVGYAKAAHESRLRIRWVLTSTALLLLSLVVQSAVSPSRYPYSVILVTAMQGLAALGYLYAVLRTRLVDVSFVVDRALVYTLLTGILFAAFSSLEHSLSKLAGGHELSLALQAGLAVLLAIALNPLHRRLEHWAAWLFFRQQYRAVAELRRFAEECTFIERDRSLLQMTVEALSAHGAGAAIYERVGSAYRRRAAMGPSWPETVDVDDPAFVALRALRKNVDLDDVASATGADGIAFPMRVGVNLIGAIICRPRDAEQFGPDVSSAIAELARNVALSLHILHTGQQACLAANIAADSIDDAAARDQAIAPAGAAPS